MYKNTLRNKNLKSLNTSTLTQGLKDQGIHFPFPWQSFSSLELADAIGVSLQTIANLRVRRSGPLQEHFTDFKGNRIMYRYDNIWAWVTGLPAWKCHQAWLEKRYPSVARDTKEDCYEATSYFIGTGAYKQHNWRRKASAGPISVFGGAS